MQQDVVPIRLIVSGGVGLVNLLDLVVLSAGPHFFVDYQSLISSPSTPLLVAHEGCVILWSTNSFVKAGH